MKKFSQTKQFGRDVKRLRRRGKNIGKLIAGARLFSCCLMRNRERAFPKLNDTIPLPSVAEKT